MIKLQKLQQENDFYYTDTDSLQMHARNAKLMKNLGNQNLGGITDDLGESAKIIRGIWVAPKLYALEYITKDSREEPTDRELNGEHGINSRCPHIKLVKGVKIHYHFRGKGLNANELCIEEYEKMAGGAKYTNVRDFQFKKINIKKNSKQLEVNDFSILHLKDISKDVNKTSWAGRNFEEGSNVSRPWR